MKVLVTGGCGFIGSEVCRQLIGETDWSVVNLDKLTYAATRSSLTAVEGSSRYTLVEGDVADGRLLAGLFAAHDFDAVVNLAAETHVDRSITGADAFIATNVQGVFELLQASLKHWDRLETERRDRFRFLQVSTDEVFGSLHAPDRFSETSCFDPRSPYSASKAGGDHLVSAWSATYGLPTLTSHCSNNYGPYQFPEKLIPLTTLNALSNRRIPVYGDGRNVRDWIHVADHVNALRKILESGRPGARYAIGGDAEWANLDLVETICDLVHEKRPEAGGRDLIDFVADRPGHDRRYAIDSSKIRLELGWTPSWDFEDGLRQTIDWYIGHEDWWRPLFGAPIRHGLRQPN